VNLLTYLWIRDTNRQKSDDSYSGKTRAKEARSAVVTEKNKPDDITTIKTQVNSLGKQVSDLCQSLKTKLQVNCGSQPLANRAVFNGNTNTGTSLGAVQRSCFNYGDPSHIKPNCPMLQGNDRKPTQSVRSGCFNCGDLSHRRESCPLLQTTNTATQQPTIVQQTPPANRAGCYQCGDLTHHIRNCPQLATKAQPQQSKTRVSVANNDSNVYVKANIEGITVDCLLDSGCEHTLMPLDLIRRCGYGTRKTNMVVRSANDTKLELAGKTTVNIRLCNDNILVQTLVSHDIDEVMLGYDYLMENDCVWSFGVNQILTGGNSYTPFARQGQPKCRRLFVTSDIVIPAKQEINFPVRSTINSLTVCGGNYITEPKENTARCLSRLYNVALFLS